MFKANPVIVYREDHEYNSHMGLHSSLHNSDTSMNIDLTNHNSNIVHLNKTVFLVIDPGLNILEKRVIH